MNRLRIPVLCLALLAVCAILCSAAGQDKAPATEKSAFRYCKENMGTYTGARAYPQRGDYFDTTPAWTSDETCRSYRVLWIDIDNDGDLDLVAAGGEAG